MTTGRGVVRAGPRVGPRAARVMASTGLGSSARTGGDSVRTAAAPRAARPVDAARRRYAGRYRLTSGVRAANERAMVSAMSRLLSVENWTHYDPERLCKTRS